MKKITGTGLLLLALLFSVQAQPGADALRSLADPDLNPFYHGVASGDPTSVSVIIWTRVSPDTEGPVDVAWIVGTDTTFADTVRHGVFITDADRDYTVKIDVDGLQPGQWYYYEFAALDGRSLTGRTKTAPAGGADQLRMAVVSCSSYETGYFNVYRKLVERNDIDVILHLGDYIYEYGSNSSLAGPRAHEPDHEIVALADYRMRHAQHKLDADALVMHQNFPMIAVWDDHESANNSWREGADNHSEGSEGAWSERKDASLQAYYEWMPIRRPDESDFYRIFRKISYGDLADIFMLDTRLYDRDLQAEFPRDFGDEDRSLIGEVQMEWLQQGLTNSTARWKILGQQVMMGPLVIPNYVAGSFTPLNNDQWDGYAAERTRLFDHILQDGIENVVTLTGDIHTSWAMDLPYDIFDYDPGTGEGSVAVEFVTTAVTSTSSPIPLPPIYSLITNALPYIKYVDLSRKGYTILDLTPERVQGDFYTVNTVVEPQAFDFFQQGWYAEDGTPHLIRAAGATELSAEAEPLAPAGPRPAVSDTVATAVPVMTADILGTYPNPFRDRIVAEVHLFEAGDVTLSLIDGKGAVTATRDAGFRERGRMLLSLETKDLPSGTYMLVLSHSAGEVSRPVIKP